ncbi:MAG TPA: gamma-glutamylcyclotransferase family protein [Terriglobia bacterium]|nr:gamma-glutamylcyclotransferase family protein [Terriglobia bacterium]
MEFENQELTIDGARLFVYGTLRRGFRAHKLLQRHHARFLGNGHVQGRLYNLGEYPGAKWSGTPGERVQGEVYFLPRAATALRALDRFEGYDPARPEWSMFERKETTVRLAGEREMRAWVYWVREGHRPGRRLLTGDFGMRRV